MIMVSGGQTLKGSSIVNKSTRMYKQWQIFIDYNRKLINNNFENQSIISDIYQEKKTPQNILWFLCFIWL